MRMGPHGLWMLRPRRVILPQLSYMHLYELCIIVEFITVYLNAQLKKQWKNRENTWNLKMRFVWVPWHKKHQFASVYIDICRSIC